MPDGETILRTAADQMRPVDPACADALGDMAADYLPTSDREEFAEARTAGLAKRQERRLAHARDPLDETLARIGRDMAQQTMAAEGHKRLGLGDRHNYHEYHRLDQGRWAFYESARLICQNFGRDFDAWLSEWRPE